ncbi:uncharacterized protein PHACADRAFT_87866 [Phanerochaete carnosa HHB-10118-sp]|uniref:RING-type domain-containing protein n=1 Tax=Phanerochaete carnosa (strain HHB-10118-sp) TaxID=650164 RepID=K5V8E6_PHACS|nr:uncharacterized protein PHACADRAFT_87866 [Phanerochaete carnosa HHB-10118-sp]EKM59081.1 hypothetical protein PHACADRAFT_87866 [Phanerochaete carnosa HHB-10118-sp]
MTTEGPPHAQPSSIARPHAATSNSRLIPLSSASSNTASTSLSLPPPPSTAPSPHDTDAFSTLDPATLLPLLRCPLCVYERASSSSSRAAALAPTEALLEQPTTLRCGHTLCAAHLSALPTPAAALPPVTGVARPCPLPTCPSRTGRTLRAGEVSTFVHPEARVGFVPAPPDADAGDNHGGGGGDDGTRDPGHRADVLVQKAVALVRRAYGDGEEQEEEAVIGGGGGVAPDDRTDDEDEDEEGASGTEAEGRLQQPAARPSSLRRPHTPSGPGRPRKRRRLVRHSDVRAPRHTTPPRDGRGAPTFEKELLAELTCEICFALLWQPVTTPCQHTFCARCLHRTMDHSSACPICRQTLPGYAYFQDHPCNKVVLSLILKAFPTQYDERGATIEAEERDARLDTPILDAQLSFPGMPTMLHLFEPRFRLMLRRCLATPHPSFGMIPRPRAAAAAGAGADAGNDYGTMLEIRNVQMLPDGRSIVETWGTYRFRIMERGVLDGYTVGRVERVEDIVDEEADAADIAAAAPAPVHAPHASGGGAGGSASAGASAAGPGGYSAAPFAGPSSRAGHHGGAAPPSHEPRRTGATNAELMTVCRDFLEELTEGTPWVGQHLHQSYVPMPADAVRFSFWMALSRPSATAPPACHLIAALCFLLPQKKKRSRAYASASPAQVVLWWLYALLTRLVPVRPPAVLHPAMLGFRRRHSIVRVGYAGWLVISAAVLWAQLGLWAGPVPAAVVPERREERR